ncbi:hypothetical protein FQR65_LT05796 [Abscondita terminalis]|nr:hypothetical protein FQR65_LT05796 [Abscondita terminalis]
MNNLKIFAYLTISITPLVLIYYVRKKYKKKLATLDNVDNSNVPCGNSCSFYDLQFILRYIDNAQHSISLCMYLLTSHEIQNSLIRLHNKGVKVRYITDAVMAQNPASKIQYLQKQGLTIKVQPKQRDNLLHHKFCLVDENHPQNSKVLFGTLNLTLQGLTTNFDTVLFTNNKIVIERYKDEFELLWSKFKEV